MSRDFYFHQLFETESSTYTYIIADKKTLEAAIIDPVLETVERDIKLIEELGYKLIYAFDTHIHADHITGAGELRKRTGAKTAICSEASVECADILLKDGQELFIGDKKILVMATPGHTNTCLSYFFEDRVFTGDSLLVRTCGRTDFQQGNSDLLYHSVHDKLFSLPDEILVFPGHDYRGFTSSTIGAEKKYNARLNLSHSVDDFRKIMSDLKLANPKKMYQAVPANLSCGDLMRTRYLNPQLVDGVPEVSPIEVNRHLDIVSKGLLKVVDVRRPEEFNNELGHIEGAILVTLGSELSQFLEAGDRYQEIVFVCRSGGRSGSATAESQRLGYKNTANMLGGMIQWNELKLPVFRD